MFDTSSHLIYNVGIMQRKKTIQIRVKDEEREAIEKQMRRENFSSISEFLRKIALDRVNENGIKA